MWGERKRRKCVFKRVDRGRKRDIGTSKQDTCSRENLSLERKSLDCPVEMFSGLSLLLGSVHLVTQLGEYLSTPFLSLSHSLSFPLPSLCLSPSLTPTSLLHSHSHSCSHFLAFLISVQGTLCDAGIDPGLTVQNKHLTHVPSLRALLLSL